MKTNLADDAGNIIRRMRELGLEKSVPVPAVPVKDASKPLTVTEIKVIPEFDDDEDEDWDGKYYYGLVHP